MTILVITRRLGEAVYVGEALIHVSEGHGNQVRLIIKAPPHVNVRRAELPVRCTCTRDPKGCEVHLPHCNSCGAQFLLRVRFCYHCGAATALVNEPQ